MSSECEALKSKTMLYTMTLIHNPSLDVLKCHLAKSLTINYTPFPLSSVDKEIMSNLIISLIHFIFRQKGKPPMPYVNHLFLKGRHNHFKEGQSPSRVPHGQVKEPKSKDICIFRVRG